MKTKMMAAVAALTLGLWAGEAAAQCHIGGQGGWSTANSSLEAGGFGVDGLGSQSRTPDVGVHAGCDIALKGTPLILGAWGEWNHQDVKFSVNPGLFSGSLGNSYAFGGRLGYKLQNGAMPYALVGWQHADMNWSAVVPIPAGLLPSSAQGMMYGAGVEVPITGTALSIAGEARLIKYQTQNIAAFGGIDLQTDQLQAMVRLNWNFGGSIPVAPLK